MYPVIVEIGPITIYSYGLMILIGILVSMQLGKKLCREAGLDWTIMYSAVIYSVIIGAAGSKLLYLGIETDFFSAGLGTHSIFDGGFVFYGVPLTAIPFGVWYLKRHSMPPWKVVDIVSVAMPLAHAFGRIGCFLAGCCHGIPTSSLMGMRFYSPLVEANLRGKLIHPTQIYESICLFLIATGMYILYKRKSFDGQVFFAYIFSYAIVRSVIEVFRGDSARGFVIGSLSTSQFISLLLALAAAGYLVFRRSRGNRLER